jgi:ribosomal protein uL13
MVVIDGEFSPLGRLASFAAQKAREGEEVIIINANNIILKKDKQEALKYYTEKISKGNNIKGPFFPSTVKGIVMRAIRGMINRKRARGRGAFKLIKVYESIPSGINQPVVKLYKEPPKVKYITLRELVNLLRHE